jgi:Rrf2 family protein
MFSKTCEYGIRAAIHLAHRSQQGKRSSLKEVAEAIDSPVAFTAKILQSLAKHKIILSVKGSIGGYEIEVHRLHKITLCDLVEAIDGDNIYNGCGLGLKECDETKPCPVHDKFKTIRDDLKDMLQSRDLSELAFGLQQGVSYLKR